MDKRNFKICDVIKFTNIDVFSYDKEYEDIIQLNKEYIIVDMFDGMLVISDGELEFILEDISLEYVKRVRRMHFKVGDEVKITNILKIKFAHETRLKQNGVYKVISIIPREGTIVVFDGENEVALFPEEMLFVEKVKLTKKYKKRVQEDFVYIPKTNEMRMLQEEIKKFAIMSLIDKSLDERNYDMLKKIVESNYMSDKGKG